MNDEDSSVIVVVGGSGGIGSAVARRLMTRGCRMVLAARNAERLQTVADQTGAQAMTTPDKSKLPPFRTSP